VRSILSETQPLFLSKSYRMPFILLSLARSSASAFLEFHGVFFPPGHIVEHFLATKGVTFLLRLSLLSNVAPHTLSIFLLNGSDPIRTPFCTEERPPSLAISSSDSTNRLTGDRESLYRLAFVNCGTSSIVVSGSVSLIAPDGHLDLRLQPLIPIFIGFAVIFVVFTIFWTYRLLRSNPTITIRHQLFALAIALGTVGAAVFLIFLVLWHTRGICSLRLLGVSAVATAASRTLLLFLTFSGLQEPSELPVWPFFVGGVFLGFAFLIEQFGIIEFSIRSTGTWVLGIGKIPYLQFIVLGGFELILLMFAVRASPPETRGSPQRSCLLVVYAVVVFAFLGASLATAAYRNGAKIGTVAEWWPFVIEPLCFLDLSGATGVFWMVFNPHGWKILDSETTSSLSVDEENSLVGGMSLHVHREQPEFVMESDENIEEWS
jgi:hypothetical protein